MTAQVPLFSATTFLHYNIARQNTEKTEKSSWSPNMHINRTNSTHHNASPTHMGSYSATTWARQSYTSEGARCYQLHLVHRVVLLRNNAVRNSRKALGTIRNILWLVRPIQTTPCGRRLSFNWAASVTGNPLQKKRYKKETQSCYHAVQNHTRSLTSSYSIQRATNAVSKALYYSANCLLWSKKKSLKCYLRLTREWAESPTLWTMRQPKTKMHMI